MIKKTFLFFLCLCLFLLVSTCKKKTPTEPIIPELIRPSIEYFGASPASVRSGDYSLLSWETYNATTASLSPGAGTVPVNGTYTVYPEETTVYQLRVENNDGHASAYCTVLVVSKAELTMTFDPVEPVFYFNPDGTCTSDFTLFLTETNGVGGRIDIIRIIGRPPDGTAYAQALYGPGSFAPYQTVSCSCAMLLYCYPQVIEVHAEGEDMHGYVIDVSTGWILLWSGNRATVQSTEVMYGPNHGRKIK